MLNEENIGSVVRAACFHSPQQDRPTEASQCNRRQHPRFDLSIDTSNYRATAMLFSVRGTKYVHRKGDEKIQDRRHDE